jgi:hypothetical protein
MTSHTPGPWRVGKKYTLDVYAGNMQGVRIAACFDDDGEANARLISAAPELLSALQSALAFINTQTFTTRFELQDQCRAAIAKAVVV